MQFPVYKYGLIFRLVEESDAPFILSLRTDPKLSRHLSPTDDNLEKQMHWIRQSRQRGLKGEEYYFLFEDENRQPLGVVRLYNLKDGTFTSGSWMIKPQCDHFVAVKSDLFVLDFAFAVLNLEKCLIDVRKENKKVLLYHKKFFTQINEDKTNIYFEMDRVAYHHKRDFLTGIIKTEI